MTYNERKPSFVTLIFFLVKLSLWRSEACFNPWGLLAKTLGSAAVASVRGARLGHACIIPSIRRDPEMNPSFHPHLSGTPTEAAAAHSRPSLIPSLPLPYRGLLKLEPAAVTKYRAHNFKWLSPGHSKERRRFPGRRPCVCVHTTSLWWTRALIEQERISEAVCSVEGSEWVTFARRQPALWWSSWWSRLLPTLGPLFLSGHLCDPSFLSLSCDTHHY